MKPHITAQVGKHTELQERSMNNGFNEFVRDCEEQSKIWARMSRMCNELLKKKHAMTESQKQKHIAEIRKLHDEAKEVFADKSYSWSPKHPEIVPMIRWLAATGATGATVETIQNGSLQIIVRGPLAQEASRGLGKWSASGASP
jgi:hypothetical protein